MRWRTILGWIVFCLLVWVFVCSVGAGEKSSLVYRKVEWSSAKSLYANSEVGQTPPNHPAIVRIVVDCPDGSRDLGSGTIIDRDAQSAFVLTAYHVLRSGGPVYVVTYERGSYGAKVLGISQEDDLALLKIQDPGINPIRMDCEDSRRGEILCFAGYGGGEFRSSHGPVISMVSYGHGKSFDVPEIAAQARDGDSGGPIYRSRGGVIGVISYRDRSTVYGACGQRVRVFLARFFPRFRSCPGGVCPNPGMQVVSPGVCPCPGGVCPTIPMPMAPSGPGMWVPSVSPDAASVPPSLPTNIQIPLPSTVPPPDVCGPTTCPVGCDPIQCQEDLDQLRVELEEIKVRMKSFSKQLEAINIRIDGLTKEQGTSAETLQQITRIEQETERLASLVQMVQVKQGPPGKDGRDGKDAPSVEALTAEVIKRLPPIRVQNIRDGKVVSSKDVPLGGTLPLRLVPVSPGAK